MSEPKPNWGSLYDGGKIGLPGSDIQISDNVARWTNPTTDKWVMNGEPLSTKALHEIIVSQSMTIDATLTRQGELVDALKQSQKLLQEGKFYEAWYEINKALGIV